MAMPSQARLRVRESSPPPTLSIVQRLVTVRGRQKPSLGARAAYAALQKELERERWLGLGLGLGLGLES